MNCKKSKSVMMLVELVETDNTSPGKLFTADANLILSTEGKVSSAAYQRVLNTVLNLLRVGHS